MRILRPRCLCSVFPREIFGNKDFFLKKYVAVGFVRNCFRSLAETFCQSGQNCILGIETYIFLEKFCFWKKNRFFLKFANKYFSAILLNFSQQVYKVCVLRVHGNLLKKKRFIFRQSSFFVLRIWPSIFSLFTQTHFVSLVETVFKVSRGTIWSKLIFLRNIFFFDKFLFSRSRNLTE